MFIESKWCLRVTTYRGRHVKHPLSIPTSTALRTRGMNSTNEKPLFIADWSPLNLFHFAFVVDLFLTLFPVPQRRPISWHFNVISWKIQQSPVTPCWDPSLCTSHSVVLIHKISFSSDCLRSTENKHQKKDRLFAHDVFLFISIFLCALERIEEENRRGKS